MGRFRVSDLESLVADLAERAGVPEEDARTLARALVDADVHGVATHGISRLGIYLERLGRGLIDPKGRLTIERQTGNVLVLDAGNALGQVQAVKALALLKPLARENGVAVATLRNSQHFGALSFYCNMAAQEGFILLAMSSGEPAMAPTGGYEAFFGTNPMAASFPNPLGAPVKVDLATSLVARGHIIAADRKNQSIPEGWALSAAGLPTTDAAEALRGTVQTMAGHKGYALALLVEMFSSVLSGAAIGPQTGSMYKDLHRKQDVGHFFCLLDTNAFLPGDEYEDRMRILIHGLKDGRKRPGVEEIFLPGEQSARKAAANREQGVPIAEETITELQKWCEHFGVAFPRSL